jgi:hypothetical protein
MSTTDPGSKSGITVHLASAGERVRARRYDHLAWVASGVAAFALARFLVWLAIAFFTGGDWRPGAAKSLSTLLLAVLALSMVGICRRARPGVEWFAWLALSFQVAAATLLGAALYGWQSLLSTSAIQQWLEDGREDPWGLGAGEVPWVGVLIIVYAVAVPLTPGQQLFGGLAGTAALAAWTIVSLFLVPIPPGLEEWVGELLGAALLVVIVPTLLCVGIGYLASRQLDQLARRLDEARELGSYRLLERLGRGGMGEVWRAQHRMLARPAAVKLLRDRGGDSSSLRTTLLERFEREVQATSQLRSPHTVNVYDYGFTEEGTFYYAMELLDGVDLEELVTATGPQAPARAVRVLEQAASSLAEAHALGLVHRDIKPANIMLCHLGVQEDFAKVLDFGLVKAREAAEDAPQLTAEFSFAGTPAYAAPEVAQYGASRATPAADIYALGCVGYWLLTGQQLFAPVPPLQLLSKHISEAPTPPSQLLPAPLPSALEDLVMQCLAKDPADRPDAVGLLAALSALELPGRWSQDDARSWWRLHGAELRGDDPAEATTI